MTVGKGPEALAGGDLLLAIEDGIAAVTFNRPQVHNAVSFEMWQALPPLFARLGEAPEVRAVVLRGAGERAFVSGADISEFETRRAAGEQARRYNAAHEAAVEAIAACPRPTIAMIHGYCMGGGAAVAMACDLRFAAGTATFAIPAARLSIAYPVSSTRRLVWLVGPSRAKDLLFSARTFDAAEAHRIGFVDRVVPAADLEAATRGYLADLARLAPRTQRAAKVVIDALTAGAGAADGRIEALVLETFDSADYAEGVRAFLEKRPPRFTGD